MESFEFYKYHGLGNDFIMINNTGEGRTKLSTALIAACCHRRFGIGADGLIFLEAASDYDFEMIYFNADGRKAEMCGNGARCAVKFAHDLELFIGDSTKFRVGDMSFKAQVTQRDIVEVQMPRVYEVIEAQESHFWLMISKVPHLVKFCSNVDKIDVEKLGAQERHHKRFERTQGVNVNFVEIVGERQLRVRTFERGVEKETFACGTGVIASVIAHAQERKSRGSQEYEVEVKGGQLKILLEKSNVHNVEKIIMQGPARRVFCGTIRLSDLSQA